VESEIVNILDVEPAALRPLLEAESRAWETELHWDYSASSRLISTWLEERRLSGYTLRSDGKIRGFCFYFLEGPRAHIADLFIEPNQAELMYAKQLLDRVLRHLLTSPQTHRVEAQLPHFSFESLAPWFRIHCFEGYIREFMAVPLSTSNTAESIASETSSRSKGDFEIAPWERCHDRQAAELLYHAYHHHVDAAINEQYASLAGVSRLLENVVYHHGCGEFLGQASFVAFHRPTRKLAGILGATRVRRETAHLPQIAVGVEFQGAGVGTALLRRGLNHLQCQGFREVSLTATSLNHGAIRLYQRLGFRTFRAFGAFVWQRHSKDSSSTLTNAM
jgi:ribosomal protein S18 acetylase RimI-like enzyme